MENDFTDKAIKCDSWEQMEHLTQIAASQNIKIGEVSKDRFCRGRTFIVLDLHHNNIIHNTSVVLGETIIHYNEFIKP